MGFFRRAASAINHADPATDLVLALDPSIRRVRKLDERGTPANGVITGIRCTSDGDTTRRELAVTVVGSAAGGAAPVRFGVRAQGYETPRLRLGVPVVAKVDGDRGILDWDAMAVAWGLSERFLAQDPLRNPPDDGIVDKALDARVQRHLKKWSPTSATIVSLERKTVLGMTTMNWDITLRLPDGSTASCTRDAVPFYAMWFAAPGVAVPAVVDPKDRTRASINWPALAINQYDLAGFDDDPPAGSVAAEVEQPATPTVALSVTVAMPEPAAPAAPAGSGGVELDLTMRSWIDAYQSGHLNQKELDRSLADWQAAGMCTAAQVEAARAAVRSPPAAPPTGPS